ncbi:MAG: phosphoribosylformylglycinamidine synthase subunit PurL [Chloroflexi bacterium]|nr:phosphoribosylformylglycinamidine synthase subunit PurL [Chloroflexota bacterium]MCI0832612.1 phosphoribosylformylglycinamidine synthase subunit PurL [Chloroflexota bacterium]
MAIDQSVLDTIALSRDEYQLIVEKLGREPNEVELGLFGALWSEHCGYKNSKPLLRLLPAEGPYVLTKRGAENAGAVDIGDGLCVVMKIESHNHPSAVEPYEGAATGVGGIVRDIFAMGARPIAILDSLRFGPLTDARNRYLFEGVVAGISGYGNCLGIPTVGGEVYFEDSYAANPLVNAMCIGVAPVEKLVTSKAEGPGNILLLAGSDTGRDGIHGASGLASRTDPGERFEELRPAVQVGNPFLEKMLLEACLDLAHNHVDWITGIQDFGAAGLTSAAIESASNGGTGIVIDVARVPRREDGMTTYEVMLSESQERMLIIVRKGHEDDVAALFERWEVPTAIIGHVTDDKLVHIFDGDQEVGTLPVELLVDAPEYTRQGEPAQELYEMESLDLSVLPDVSDTGAALLRLLAAPNITSKRWVHRQYDQSVLSNTVVEAGADAAVLRIKPAEDAPADARQRGIALATDGNGRYCHVDPYRGASIAVAEAARNVVCAGAQPVAVTDCLNFGNPERPDVYHQMQAVIQGIAEACDALGTPVISGNVSLYNETGGQPIYPTPVIGMLGILDDVSQHCTMAPAPGDALFLLGSSIEQRLETLAASEYLRLEHGKIGGRLEIDLQLEGRVQRAALAAIRQDLATAAHDCSDGGLAVTLAEMCLAADAGLDAAGAVVGNRLDAALFGEAQSRIVLAIKPERRHDLVGIASSMNVPLEYIGAVTADGRFRFGPIDLPLADLRDAYENGLERALAG